MTAVYILAALAALAALILLSDITFRIVYRDGKFGLRLRWLFISRGLPEKKKAPDGKKEKAEKAGQRESRKPDLGLSDTAGLISELASRLGKIVSKARIRPCMIHIKAACGDAAQTALAYGACCAGLALLDRILSESFGRVKGDFQASWDYGAESPDVRVNAVIRIRVIWLIGPGVGAVRAFMKTVRPRDAGSSGSLPGQKQQNHFERTEMNGTATS